MLVQALSITLRRQRVEGRVYCIQATLRNWRLQEFIYLQFYILALWLQCFIGVKTLLTLRGFNRVMFKGKVKLWLLWQSVVHAVQRLVADSVVVSMLRALLSNSISNAD